MVAGIGFPHTLNERADLLVILLSRERFDAARNIDAERPQQPHGLGHIVRRQAAGDDDAIRQSIGLFPAKRLAAAAAGIEQRCKHTIRLHLSTQVAMADSEALDDAT